MTDEIPTLANYLMLCVNCNSEKLSLKTMSQITGSVKVPFHQNVPEGGQLSVIHFFKGMFNALVLIKGSSIIVSS